MPAIPPTLLLIANHPQFIYLIKRYGQQSGCRVLSVGSIEAAIALLQDRPAMVLLHLTAWSHDGWPILRRLKQNGASDGIPITIISALADEARARTEGATYWLWQPVMYTDFLAALVATGTLPSNAALCQATALDNPGTRDTH
jgi:CheY-like chemotaxis protein